MEPQPVIIEKTVQAPVSKVWKAITDKEDMKQWYFDLEEFRPVQGFEFSFNGKGKTGETMVHLCRVTEVVPERKLAYSWRYPGYEGNSLVTFDLFPEGNSTRVKLTHSGLDTFPAMEDFRREDFVMGWTELIGKLLPRFLENKG